MSKGFQQTRRNLDELTQEKFGEHAGKRSLKRCAALFGLVLLLIIFVQAEIIYMGLLLNPEATDWGDYRGWFQWMGVFAGSTLIPYIASHFRR